MKLSVFNGSPKGRKANTEILLERFLNGFAEEQGNQWEVLYLNRRSEQKRFRDAFSAADSVLVAYPLYTDAMPGIVKQFIETLEPLCGVQDNKPALGFLVQSGFMEAAHSRYVERYHIALARRLGCTYLGTIIRGGVEGIQMRPEKMSRRLFSLLEELGRIFGSSGTFDEQILNRLARPERLPGWVRLLLRLLALTGFTNLFWDRMLKANGAYERRFARPYAQVIEK
jgi:hypothetical protein